MASKAKRVIIELFNLFMEDPTVLPDEWRYSGKKNFKNNQASKNGGSMYIASV